MAVSVGKKISTILKLLFEPKVLSSLLSLRIEGFLFTNGWFNAKKSGTAVNLKDEPIPWTTYSFIDFIELRLEKKFIMFEYGSGNSTIYFANKVEKLFSVEHDKKWHEKIVKTIPSNVNLQLTSAKSPETYMQPIINPRVKFDIIFIDGVYRSECMIESVNHLTDVGVIILDDSERAEYEPGIKFLDDKNFKNLPFWGISPGQLYKKCTTIFYRSGNCLGI